MHSTRFRSLGIAVTAVSALIALAPARSSAQLTLTFASPTQNGIRGSTLSFIGTLTNTSGVEQFLNSASFTLPGIGLTLDDSPFIFTAPLSLTGGQVYTGQLFTVAVAANAPVQSIGGTFSVVGGRDGNASSTLATQSFRVNVASAAPEPGSAGLLLLGGLAFIPAVRRARRRQNAQGRQ
ncbi:MAG: hypothetical protein V4671_21255 [Armatimonadota bacterium]